MVSFLLSFKMWSNFWWDHIYLEGLQSEMLNFCRILKGNLIRKEIELVIQWRGVRKFFSMEIFQQYFCTAEKFPYTNKAGEEM